MMCRCQLDELLITHGYANEVLAGGSMPITFDIAVSSELVEKRRFVSERCGRGSKHMLDVKLLRSINLEDI